MDPITRRRISKRMRLAAASGGIHWLTMASIRRFAIWLTTVSRKNRQRRRPPPHRRVRWTLHHVSHSMASLILLLLTTTITIPLKGNHNSALIVFYFFFQNFLFPFYVWWKSRSDHSLSGLDSPLPPPPIRCCCIQGCVRKKAVLKDGRRPAVSAWQRYWIQLSGSNLLFYQSKHLRG